MTNPLDRMATASFQPAGGTSGLVATLQWDPLSRRKSTTWADGSSATYGYDAADRTTSIAHVFPNGTASNVTIGYGYDQAGRETSRTISNPAYGFARTQGTTAYGVANALNQYPTVGGAAQGFWAEGPVSTDGGFYRTYDEQNRLIGSYASPGGTTDYNNWTVSYIDALGHTYVRYRNPSSAGPQTLTYFSTDGLRDEDRIGEV